MNKKNLNKKTAKAKRINWANIMVYFRFALIPVIMFTMLSKDLLMANVISVCLYYLACITDLFDGWWARKHDMVTDLGKVLDPIADKVAVLCIFLVLAKTKFGALEILLSGLIIFREILVSGVREFTAVKGHKIEVSYIAKWKTTFQMFAVGGLMLGTTSPQMVCAGSKMSSMFLYYFMPLVYKFGLVFLAISTVLTVLTGWQYFKGSIKYMK
ncbi:MAG: CDP-diacylglycerol--glycerol-3-phosphate 3-phosphatidyltransferase [Alphaproteobacteria bacterium]|jgi:CDP-diacylglycerol--glycerol-3-phosphate 3-phosphatidyltransferase|nr:CDP-diacylglycerol--glycerol-3-phosphate 3-phosphatidyltransferase [Alphaproteobacteria bacterium]